MKIALLVGLLLLLAPFPASPEPPVSEGHQALAIDECRVPSRESQPDAEPTQDAAPFADAGEDQPSDPGEEAAARKKNGSANVQRWWPPPWPPPDSGWAVVYVTAIYVLVSIIQAAATIWQGSLAKASIRMLERPWVVVTPTRLDGFTTPPIRDDIDTIPLRFVFTATNNGRSSAWITGRAERILVYPPGKAPFFRPRMEATSGDWFPIAAGQAREMSDNYALGTTDYGRVAAVRRLLVFAGLIQYEDVFGRRHRTRYAFLVIPNRPVLGAKEAPYAFRIWGRRSYNRVI